MTRRSHISLIALAAALAAPAAGAQTSAPAAQSSGERTVHGFSAPGQVAGPGPGYFAPGATYDPAIPTLRQIVGHDLGGAMSTHADIIGYFEALAAAAPDRMRIFEYGHSWQGRRLIYAVIGTPERMARLDSIQADARRLADPRGLAPGEAEAIIARHPAVVWLAHTVHGDEPGPSDSAMHVAYHLLAARNDPVADAVRSEVLTVIVPVQNPDGRDRFISGNLVASGLAPDPHPLSAERDQQWPGGRVNHAVFDLNRDWFAQTQPETRAHTAAILSWMPNVMVDAHEMGTDQTFFFPPEAEPVNPLVPREQRALRDLIGRNNAGRFDQAGINYFTREVFDLFYPGYGDGWPSAHGAVSMTYEQGSSRGLLARRSDGRAVTYAETVRNQFVAAMATLETAARNRERFVRATWEFRRTAVEEGRNDAVKAWIIPPQADQSAADRLASTLVRNGIEVGRAASGFQACGKNWAAGAYVIQAAQPARRLARNLLDREIPLDPAFVARQEARRAQGLPDEIYDVTAWSPALLHNVAVETCGQIPAARTEPVGTEPPAGSVEHAEARAAFVVDSGSGATARFMVAALQAGLVVRSLEQPFTVDGRRHPAGSLVIPASENAPGYAARVAEIARATGAQARGLDTTWVSDGPSFGSPRAITLRAPRVAVAWDQPADRYSAGAVRYTLERKLGLPVTVIRSRRLASAALDTFDVVILPDAEGDYGAILGEAGARNLKGFVRSGGVLIGLGAAVAWMADPKVDLTALRRERAHEDSAAAEARPPAAEPEDGGSTVDGIRIADPAGYQAAILPAERDPIPLSGAILGADTDAEHWLTAGLARRVHIMMTGSDIYRPLTRDQGENVVRFASAGDLTASGVVWPANRAQLAYKPLVALQPMGRGFVVAFTADPTWRGQTDGLDGLLAAAIYQTVARSGRPAR